MIGYIVININKDWSPPIGVKFDSYVFVVTRFNCKPVKDDVYKIEFEPTGPMKHSAWGDGYIAKAYTVLELI